MARPDAVDNIFEELDTNRDGNIDRKELRNWVAKGDGLASSTYEMSTYGHNTRDNVTSRYDRYTNDSIVNTNGPEETKRYLERSGINVYIDSNPQIVRRKTTERPVTYEQRVVIRCLQPPPLPPLEPLIIKEVRPEQPPPPPPLVIRETKSYVSSAPPLVLRERPPTPPARIGSEIVTRELPPVPLPPRSLIVERISNTVEKPRDIIIERWCPYPQQQLERRKIVQPAPPPIKYPAPTHTIIEYDGADANVVRKFERLGVSQEDPESYVARYGTSLLDPTVLLQEARRAGVIEDISCPLRSSSINATSTSSGFGYEKIQHAAIGETTKVATSSCSGSKSYVAGDNTSVRGTWEMRPGSRCNDGVLSPTNLKRDGEGNTSEVYRHF